MPEMIKYLHNRTVNVADYWYITGSCQWHQIGLSITSNSPVLSQLFPLLYLPSRPLNIGVHCQHSLEQRSCTIPLEHVVKQKKSDTIHSHIASASEILGSTTPCQGLPPVWLQIHPLIENNVCQAIISWNVFMLSEIFTSVGRWKTFLLFKAHQVDLDQDTRSNGEYPWIAFW